MKNLFFGPCNDFETDREWVKRVSSRGLNNFEGREGGRRVEGRERVMMDSATRGVRMKGG